MVFNRKSLITNHASADDLPDSCNRKNQEHDEQQQKEAGKELRNQLRVLCLHVLVDVGIGFAFVTAEVEIGVLIYQLVVTAHQVVRLALAARQHVIAHRARGR